jgi:alanine racemase
LNSLNHSAVDGFLILGLEPDRSEVQMLRRRGVPFVLVDTSESDGVSVVSVDDRAGATAAMKHLLDLGHRRVSIVAIESGHGGRFGHYTGVLRERLQGYADALATRGMRPGHGSVRVVEAESSLEGGRRALDNLLAGRWRPTGVAVMSDIQALGILDAARSKGMEVPSELSVVGYDDIPAAEHASPPLTTVRQPIIEKAEAAASLLVQAIADGPPTKGARTVLQPKLVIRSSSVPPARHSASK